MGKSCGTVAPNVDLALKCVGYGYDFVAIASDLGVGYVHSPDASAIAAAASQMMADATLTTQQEKELSVLRPLEWPFALGLAALLAWEAAALSGRARTMRRTHVI